MTPPPRHTPATVVMVRPHHFHPNPQTAADNGFQRRPGRTAAPALAAAARREFDTVAETLQARGVGVLVFDDHGERDTPDSVFPNNWFSTHEDGRICLHPMACANRRRERRQDVLDALAARFAVRELVDHTAWERAGMYLEGTGAMVLDRAARLAYCARSKRAHPLVLERFCEAFGYRALAVDTADRQGRPVYHTNVMLCVTTTLALAGLALVPDAAQARRLAEGLRAPGRELIELSAHQVGEFAGNALELWGAEGPLLAMSARGLGALTRAQRRRIERTLPILPLAVPTIELAGGSVRCMLAGVHLPPHSKPR